MRDGCKTIPTNMKKTQIQIVKEQLKESGEVTRNWCLQKYISRLSAIVQILEQEGYTFQTSHRDGDYVYKAVVSPTEPPKTHYWITTPEGRKQVVWKITQSCGSEW